MELVYKMDIAVHTAQVACKQAIKVVRHINKKWLTSKTADNLLHSQVDKVSGLRSTRREFRPLGNLCLFLTDLSFKIFLTQTANFRMFDLVQFITIISFIFKIFSPLI